jgi:hypothetical protein
MRAATVGPKTSQPQRTRFGAIATRAFDEACTIVDVPPRRSTSRVSRRTSQPGVSCPQDTHCNEMRVLSKCSSASWPWSPQKNCRIVSVIIRRNPFRQENWQRHRQPNDAINDGGSETYILVMNNKV